MTTIRRATATDEPAIRACAEAAYTRYIAAIGRKPAPMLADYAADIAAGHVHAASDAAGVLQGFIVFFPRDGRMFLENVAVLPSAAGRGLGKALMAHCEAAARQAGLAAVDLYTNEMMAENLAIYPRLGYAETGRRREDGFNRVFFSKSLR
ncbi:MAG: GNAT family N-acetyltransferase [Rhodobacteraceae bacterium]|nr:GNAT family N-acetyltransferase [Paracoccaceae bacterium]